MNQRGFTLIELSIVLAIIGLIIGSIAVLSTGVVGNAKVTATITMIKDLNKAVNDFKSKYHYLPGDLPQASQDLAGIAASSACDKGGGNGLLDDAANEIPCVAAHLVAAEMIKGTPAGLVSPYSSASNPDTFVISAGQSAVGAGAAPFGPTVRNVIEIRNIQCQDAVAIDEKYDDGIATTGVVRLFPLCANNSARTSLDVAL